MLVHVFARKPIIFSSAQLAPSRAVGKDCPQLQIDPQLSRTSTGGRSCLFALCSLAYVHRCARTQSRPREKFAAFLVHWAFCLYFRDFARKPPNRSGLRAASEISIPPGGPIRLN